MIGTGQVEGFRSGQTTLGLGQDFTPITSQQLACYYSMDAGKRYATLELETKDVVISDPISSIELQVCIGSFAPQVPQG